MPNLKRFLSSIIAVFIVFFAFESNTPLNAADVPVVQIYAAASTTNAVTDICALFSDKHHIKTVTSFASSSTLAKQIENGAPSDIYISADTKWMDYLDDKNLIDHNTRFNLLSNRIIMITPKDSPVSHVTINATLDIPALLGDGWLAMGDPSHVPAGIYAKYALESLGLYEKIKNKIARTKDVGQPLHSWNAENAH